MPRRKSAADKPKRGCKGLQESASGERASRFLPGRKRRGASPQKSPQRRDKSTPTSREYNNGVALASPPATKSILKPPTYVLVVDDTISSGNHQGRNMSALSNIYSQDSKSVTFSHASHGHDEEVRPGGDVWAAAPHRYVPLPLR